MYMKMTAPIVLLVAVTAILTSCAPTGTEDPLTWLGFPLDMTGTLSVNDSSCELRAEFDGPDRGRITADGTEYLYVDGSITLGAKGMMLPIVITPPFVGFTAGVMSLDKSMLTATESDGETVSAEFRTENAVYTAVTGSDGRLISITDGRFTFVPDAYTK